MSVSPAVGERGPSLHRQIGRSGLGMLAANLLSYLLRFVKMKIIAVFFGTSAVLGAYYAALNIPLTATGLFTTAITATLVPILIEIRTRRGEAEARRLWSRFGVLMLAGVFLLCALIALFPRPVIRLLIDPTIYDEALGAHLLRLLIGYLALWITVQYLVGIFHSHRRVVFPMAMGLPNIAINIVIVWALLAGPWRDLPMERQILALVWGLYAGGAFVFAALIVEGLRTGILRPAWGVAPELRRTLRSGGGLLLSTLVSPAILITVDTIMAAPIGQITEINYAYQLFMVPVTLGILSMGQVLLPYLSGQVAERDWTGLSGTLSVTVRVLLFTMAPMSVGLWLVAEDVVRLFEGGEFTAEDTALVSAALQAFAWGLLLAALGNVAQRVLTALQRVRALLLLMGMAFAVKIAVNAALRGPAGVEGLAWGTTIYHAVAVMLLGGWMLRSAPVRLTPIVRRTLLLSLTGCAAMTLCVLGVQWGTRALGLGLIPRLGVAVAAGAVAWAAWGWLTRMEEMTMLLRLVRRRR